MNEHNYGFLFNNISIQDDIVTKRSKNKTGKTKLLFEINFYLYIISNNINFPMPKLLTYGDDNLSIQYISNAYPITTIITRENVDGYINKIKTYLKNIHINTLPISTDILHRDLYIELHTKVINRFDEFDWKSDNNYNSIQYVNNLKIKTIHYYCETIHSKLLTALYKRNHYNLIHGDIHLGNILLDTTDKIYFIDPRGYFGETALFGLYEYDYAKLLFGLSGYSAFDNMNIDELKITNNNIEIDFIKNYEFIFDNDNFNNIEKLFCMSIWLANNSCFLSNNKKITSLMIAYYYCEKYLSSI